MSALARRPTHLTMQLPALPALSRATRRGVGRRHGQPLLQVGLDDGLILEVIANIALNTLTNYTNHIADTTVDFRGRRLISIGI